MGWDERPSLSIGLSRRSRNRYRHGHHVDCRWNVELRFSYHATSWFFRFFFFSLSRIPCPYLVTRGANEVRKYPCFASLEKEFSKNLKWGNYLLSKFFFMISLRSDSVWGLIRDLSLEREYQFYLKRITFYTLFLTRPEENDNKSGIREQNDCPVL